MDKNVMVVLIVVGFGMLYFLPTTVANFRNHHNAGAIAATNILLGWTFIGWCIAFIWACTEVREGR